MLFAIHSTVDWLISLHITTIWRVYARHYEKLNSGAEMPHMTVDSPGTVP
ncbi:MAG: hypothetical protein QOJ95_477 [Mycobacterium sp.]|jgi:hypothetical protein|nr:hypothetical protein [Mycobacterium sp.]